MVMELIMQRSLKEGQIIYMVFVCCLKEDVQCKNPMKACKNCTPGNFEPRISRVVYTADKKPLLGTKYFATQEAAEAKKIALAKELRAVGHE